MNRLKFFLIYFCVLIHLSAGYSDYKDKYEGLDSRSFTQNMAFYKLYPSSEEGKRALERSWEILCRTKAPSESEMDKKLTPLLFIINNFSLKMSAEIDPDSLDFIDKLGENLGHKKLKGSKASSFKELILLENEDIDIARAILISQYSWERKNFDEISEADMKRIKSYEAHLDLMALQISHKLPSSYTEVDILNEINHYVFYELKFRFPPHSLHAKNIDTYTFLPFVIDNRQGVCLGTSILYLSLAQRLNLPLEIVTPPGHIYLRYRGEKIINIETTARGVDTPSESYTGINTKDLQIRSLKNVIGLSFFNQASVAWRHKDFESCIQLYEKALLFIKEDPLIQKFLAFHYLFTNQTKKGVELFKRLKTRPLSFIISQESIIEDYLNRKIDEEGIQAVYETVDENRASIEKKQQHLQKILEKHPKYREGLFYLATTYLQLGRSLEAKKILERYERIDSQNINVNYYLCILNIERYNYIKAWEYFDKTEKIAKDNNHYPRVLMDLKRRLRTFAPDPANLKTK